MCVWVHAYTFVHQLYVWYLWIYGDQEHELNLSAEAYIQPWQCFEVDDCKACDF